MDNIPAPVSRRSLFVVRLGLPAGVSKYTTHPSASSISLSNPKNAVEEGWWVLVTTVFPSSRASALRARTSATAPVLSRPLAPDHALDLVVLATRGPCT